MEAFNKARLEMLEARLKYETFINESSKKTDNTVNSELFPIFCGVDSDVKEFVLTEDKHKEFIELRKNMEYTHKLYIDEYKRLSK